MKKWFAYDEHNPGKLLFNLLLVFGILLLAYGFLWDTPFEVISGTYRIIVTKSGLITDSMVVGGVGAAFANAGLVTLLTMFLIRFFKAPCTGITIAAVFLMAGFALFGKDIWNIMPIIFGGWLYSKYQKERFSRYLYISLFATSISPIVTELSHIFPDQIWFGLLLSITIGILIGFIMPAISIFTVGVHQGFNLYNVGFAAGLIGMVFASVSRSLGFEFDTQLAWSSGNNVPFTIFLLLLFGMMIAAGFFYNGRSFKGTWKITRHSGRAVADFIFHDSLPIVLINMGILGIISTSYVLLVGGELNGPTIGGILTISGFGGFGKHIKNTAPVVAGVILSSFLMVWKLNDPSVLLATLFATGLAPIAGQYGWKWGILAGMIHSSVVLNVSFLHGGLNLYNNGFAAGLVCIILVPLAESFYGRKQMP